MRRMVLTVSAVALASAAAVAASPVSLFPDLRPQKPDMDEVRAQINDRTSPYYYPRLMEEYAKNDTLMKLDKYRHLYLGYMLQEDYDPYRQPYPIPDRILRLYSKEDPTRAEADSIIRYATLSLHDNPLDLLQIQSVIHALRHKGNTNLAKIWEYKLRYILMAIVSTGTGLDEENAWYIAQTQHEYVLLNMMGLKVDNHVFYEPSYEFITVKDRRGAGAGGYYFNIGPLLEEYYRKHPDDLQ